MEFKDYYKVLGVERSASPEEIKRAYRQKARKYHPDVSKEKDAEARFKEIAEAYEVLKDPEKRRAYDQLGADWQAGQDFRPPPGWQSREFHGAEAGDFSDFFESLFGGMGRGGGGSPFESVFGDIGRRGGADQRAAISIPLEEAYHGATRTLTLEETEPTADGRVRRRPRQLRVSIPAGVREGQQIRLAGQGSPGPRGEAGDLYLEVHVAPHRLFRLEGRDIHLELPLAPWEAALGASVSVPTLGGTVDMKIPAGAQSGRRFRLKGRGLPGKPAGDQYVTLKLVNPPVRDEKVKEAFRRLQEAAKFDPRAGMGN